MAPLKVFATVAMAVAALFHCALAATITVGAPGGAWDQITDLQTWAASQKFTTADTLVFQYTASHDVVEVNKAGYDACQVTSAIRTYTGGNTAITLSNTGKRYFICGSAGHCAGGMKVEVDVVSAATSAPPPAVPAIPPPPPKSAPTPKAPKSSPSPTAAAPTPGAPKSSPSPSSTVPEPTAPVEPSGSPPTTSPSGNGSTPQGAPSAAGGLKASAAAAGGFVCGLVIVLAF